MPSSWVNDAPKGEKREFYRALDAFMTGRGTPIAKVPKLGHKDIDLHMLYLEVVNRGGVQRVIETKSWKEICRLFNFPATCTNAGFTLRIHYQKCLGAYERVHLFGHPDDVSTDVDVSTSKRKKTATSSNSPISSASNSPGLGSNNDHAGGVGNNGGIAVPPATMRLLPQSISFKSTPVVGGATLISNTNTNVSTNSGSAIASAQQQIRPQPQHQHHLQPQSQQQGHGQLGNNNAVFSHSVSTPPSTMRQQRSATSIHAPPQSMLGSLSQHHQYHHASSAPPPPRDDRIYRNVIPFNPSQVKPRPYFVQQRLAAALVSGVPMYREWVLDVLTHLSFDGSGPGVPFTIDQQSDLLRHLASELDDCEKVINAYQNKTRGKNIEDQSPQPSSSLSSPSSSSPSASSSSSPSSSSPSLRRKRKRCDAGDREAQAAAVSISPHLLSLYKEFDYHTLRYPADTPVVGCSYFEFRVAKIFRNLAYIHTNVPILAKSKCSYHLLRFLNSDDESVVENGLEAFFKISSDVKLNDKEAAFLPYLTDLLSHPHLRETALQAFALLSAEPKNDYYFSHIDTSFYEKLVELLTCSQNDEFTSTLVDIFHNLSRHSATTNSRFASTPGCIRVLVMHVLRCPTGDSSLLKGAMNTVVNTQAQKEALEKAMQQEKSKHELRQKISTVAAKVLLNFSRHVKNHAALESFQADLTEIGFTRHHCSSFAVKSLTNLIAKAES